MAEVQYRMVAGRDMLPAAEFLASKGYPVPNPMLAVAWVAEVGGKVVGAMSLDTVPMITGIRVEDEFQDSSIGVKLFNQAHQWLIEEGKIRTVYMHSANPTMKKMLEKIDAEESADTFFQWNNPGVK